MCPHSYYEFWDTRMVRKSSEANVSTIRTVFFFKSRQYETYWGNGTADNILGIGPGEKRHADVCQSTVSGFWPRVS